MYKLLATAVISAFALAQTPVLAQEKAPEKKEEKKAEAKKTDTKAEAKPAEAKKEEKKPKKGGC